MLHLFYARAIISFTVSGWFCFFSAHTLSFYLGYHSALCGITPQDIASVDSSSRYNFTVIIDFSVFCLLFFTVIFLIVFFGSQRTLEVEDGLGPPYLLLSSDVIANP